jgi:hypothetical protein
MPRMDRALSKGTTPGEGGKNEDDKYFDFLVQDLTEGRAGSCAGDKTFTFGLECYRQGQTFR